MEPRSMDNHLIRTPRYYGQFRLSRRKAHLFSLKFTRLIRTPVNTDNGHFSVSRLTNSHTKCQTHLTGTGYLYTVYFHWHNYVLIDGLIRFIPNTEVVAK